MIILPFDFVLTVGTATAVFVLGCSVWARQRGAVGNLLFGLLALALTIWTSADWFLHLQGTALPQQVLVWKLLFYVSVCFSPNIALHIAAFVANRSFRNLAVTAYGVSIVSYVLIAWSIILASTIGRDPLTDLALSIGAGIGVAFYALSFLLVGTFIYPLFFSSQSSTLHKRRASYAVVLLVPFLMAGGLQLLSGPVPIGFVMPILSSLFVFVALLSFQRASFLEITFGSLEAFFVPLLSFSIVVMMRAANATEFMTNLIGVLAIGAYGYLAIRTVGAERLQRARLEETNVQLKRLSQARMDFVDMVAHQLRSPLGGIHGMTSMLQDGDFGKLPEKANKAVGQISDVSQRLLSLSETFLNASRVGLGTYESVLIQASVADEVKAVAEELRQAAVSKGLGYEIELDSRLPAVVMIDKEVLRNALFNLVDNAIKYTTHGKVQIQAIVENDELAISVHDTGQGMTSEEAQSLFQKFHRGSSAQVHEKDGTGLGLYVVRRLTEAAHGSVGCMSDGPDKGSTFTLRLPLIRVDEPAAKT